MQDKKILIIESDFESLKSLSRFLLDAKFDVITAFDGEEGLEKAKTEDPDLIILEPQLPKMNGFDLCSIIAMDFERKIPVIILTEFFQDYKNDILHSFGAAAYLNKPFEKENLFYTILDLLKENGKEKVKEIEKPVSAPVQFSEAPREKQEPKSNMDGGNGKNGGNGRNGNNGNDCPKQIERLLSSYTFEVSQTLKSILAQDGNGSQKKNGRVVREKVNVDDMLKDVMSEFGLTYKKRTSLKEDIRALNDLIASC